MNKQKLFAANNYITSQFQQRIRLFLCRDRFRGAATKRQHAMNNQTDLGLIKALLVSSKFF